MRRYQVRVKGKEPKSVTVEPLEGSLYRVTVGGKSYEVDGYRTPRGNVSLLMNGESHFVRLNRDKFEYDVQYRGHMVKVEVLEQEKAFRNLGNIGAGGPQKVSVSMPGKVKIVEVKVGDEVEAGQGLLVIEAMKMENEIKAAGPGVVKKINVSPGDTMEGGQVLMIIE